MPTSRTTIRQRQEEVKEARGLKSFSSSQQLLLLQLAELFTSNRSPSSKKRGKGPCWSVDKIVNPAFNHYAFSLRVGRAILLRFRPSRCVERNSKGRDRGSQRKLTVLSLPGLLCDRSSSNGGLVPDGREAVRTPAKPSPRRRPSCSVAPRETHPAALQQTTTRHDDAPLHYKRHYVASCLSGARIQYFRARNWDNRKRENV